MSVKQNVKNDQNASIFKFRKQQNAIWKPGRQKIRQSQTTAVHLDQNTAMVYHC